MDAFEKRYPHLRWSWLRRKRFLIGYDVGMAISYWRTRWYQFRRGHR